MIKNNILGRTKIQLSKNEIYEADKNSVIKLKNSCNLDLNNDEEFWEPEDLLSKYLEEEPNKLAIKIKPFTKKWIPRILKHASNNWQIPSHLSRINLEKKDKQLIMALFMIREAFYEYFIANAHEEENTSGIKKKSINELEKLHKALMTVQGISKKISINFINYHFNLDWKNADELKNKLKEIYKNRAESQDEITSLFLFETISSPKAMIAWVEWSLQQWKNLFQNRL